jgi:hypothetical protein
MLGVDPDIASSALRLWVAAGSAALLVFVCAVAFSQSRTRNVTRLSVVVVGAMLGAVLAWAFLDGASVRDQGAERRALELRATELNARAITPGSSLACLDGLAGDSVEAACEKALFAAPATVAAATSYVAARLVLLADTAAYIQRGGAHVEGVLLPLRRSLESDRFGFVAHTLAVRDGCTSENCKALSLLHDPSRVRANLSGQTLDRYLDRYVTAWAQSSEVPVADATSSQAPAQPGAQGRRKVLVDIDFPSASSIPAVSIMNPEPKGPMTAAAAAAAVTAGADSSAQAVAPAPPLKQARKPAKNAQATTAAIPPPAPSAPVEPVWSPGATLASPQPAATAPTPAAAGPVQLNPFPAPPEASAGAAARPQ